MPSRVRTMSAETAGGNSHRPHEVLLLEATNARFCSSQNFIYKYVHMYSRAVVWISSVFLYISIETKNNLRYIMILVRHCPSFSPSNSKLLSRLGTLDLHPIAASLHRRQPAPYIHAKTNVWRKAGGAAKPRVVMLGLMSSRWVGWTGL